MNQVYESDLCIEDYVEFQQLICPELMRQSPVGLWHKAASLSIWLLLVVFVFSLLRAFEYAGARDSIDLWVAGALGAICVLFWFFCSARMQLAFMRKSAVAGGSIIGKMKHSVSSEGILEQGDGHEFFCSWERVFAVKESKNLIIFLSDPAKGIMIKRSSIPSAQYDELFSYARSTVENGF